MENPRSLEIFADFIFTNALINSDCFRVNYFVIFEKLFDYKSFKYMLLVFFE